MPDSTEDWGTHIRSRGSEVDAHPLMNLFYKLPNRVQGQRQHQDCACWQGQLALGGGGGAEGTQGRVAGGGGGPGWGGGDAKGREEKRGRNTP